MYNGAPIFLVSEEATVVCFADLEVYTTETVIDVTKNVTECWRAETLGIASNRTRAIHSALCVACVGRGTCIR